MIKKSITYILFFLLIASCNNQEKRTIDDQLQSNPDEEEWLTLFTGKNLDDFKIKITNYPLGENYKNTFRVENGILKASYKDYDTFNNDYGLLFYKNPYSYYKLKLDYRFNGEQVKGGQPWANKNSGIMLHSQSPESMGKGQYFPVSIEFQFLGGLGVGERPTANLCTPGTAITLNDSTNFQHCINSNSKTYEGNQWVSIEAVVLGDEKIIHLVESDTVMQYTNPIIGGGLLNVGADSEWDATGVENKEEWLARDGEALSKGYIALQAESTPIDFRNIKLLELCGCMDKKAKNYKSYYIKADNSKCIYE